MVSQAATTAPSVQTPKIQSLGNPLLLSSEKAIGKTSSQSRNQRIPKANSPKMNHFRYSSSSAAGRGINEAPANKARVQTPRIQSRRVLLVITRKVLWVHEVW